MRGEGEAKTIVFECAQKLQLIDDVDPRIAWHVNVYNVVSGSAIPRQVARDESVLESTRPSRLTARSSEEILRYGRRSLSHLEEEEGAAIRMSFASERIAVAVRAA
ncbi:hypothetical protein LSH36_424g02028 [Paralvinella palmiformis]|uniref:Uncharacterized protein n=1 Tax=Paralvinella palmiformis TaxID=53620 RepID=A0AAD9JCU9_9ANNE|nr:hypothetical protein LSH36_424g02028 [Paralvinella palmiformis]